MLDDGRQDPQRDPDPGPELSPKSAPEPSRAKREMSEVTAQASASGTYSGKRGFDASDEPSRLPSPVFTVLGADVVKAAAAPTMKFTLGITEPLGNEVFTIALSVQVQLDPAQRSYDADTKQRLFELFGEPSRWAATTRSFQWAQVFVLVPAFTGTTTFEVPVAGNFDLELAATKYFYSLPDGDIPLTFHFSGSIYYRGEAGRVQVVQVPWSCQAKFKLPVFVWRSMVDAYYPNTAWVALRRQTLDLLLDYKAKQGLATLDACISRLLGADDFHKPNPFAFKPERRLGESSS